MKRKSILAGLAAMVLGLAGCGGGTDAAEELLEQAKVTMASVSSMAAEMTMEMDMGMEGEVLETTTTATILTQQEPFRMQMEMEMQMGDGAVGERMLMYAEEADGMLQSYLYSADTWYAETLELGELDQYNAEGNMDLYLDHIEKYQTAGTAEIDGVKTTKVSGIITGDAMEEALAASGMESSAASMGVSEEMLADMYDELGDLPISLWIDEAGYVRQYEMDMTEMMQKIMDSSMAAMGLAEEEIAVEIAKTAITMVCGQFNEVGEIEIPAEALLG